MAIRLSPLVLGLAAVADIIITTAVITAAVTLSIIQADFRTQVVTRSLQLVLQILRPARRKQLFEIEPRQLDEAEQRVVGGV